jgi:DNA-directed RNA polymerase specialized sigma24 family protein
VDVEIEPDQLAGGHKSPEEVFIEHAEEDAILELVRRVLDPREQLALWLRCFEDLSVDEITRRLQIPGAAGARAVLQGARRKLRAALAQGATGGRRTEP